MIQRAMQVVCGHLSGQLVADTIRGKNKVGIKLV